MGFFERIARCFRRRCPKCRERALRNRSWIRATCVDRKGRRYPDSWTYYSCDSCGARFKIYLRGLIEEPSDAEWSEYVLARPGPGAR